MPKDMHTRLRTEQSGAAPRKATPEQVGGEGLWLKKDHRLHTLIWVGVASVLRIWRGTLCQESRVPSVCKHCKSGVQRISLIVLWMLKYDALRLARNLDGIFEEHDCNLLDHDLMRC